jgi:hypothetical protein
MGASSATPVEMLRDKDYQAKNGHTSSIMDYARCPCSTTRRFA